VGGVGNYLMVERGGWYVCSVIGVKLVDVGFMRRCLRSNLVPLSNCLQSYLHVMCCLTYLLKFDVE
jgi:hypothetical protein